MVKKITDSSLAAPKPGKTEAVKAERAYTPALIVHDDKSFTITLDGAEAIKGKLRVDENTLELAFLEGYGPKPIKQALDDNQVTEKIKEDAKERWVELHFFDKKSHPETELAVILSLEKMGVGMQQLTPVRFDWIKIVELKITRKPPEEVVAPTPPTPAPAPVEPAPLPSPMATTTVAEPSPAVAAPGGTTPTVSPTPSAQPEQPPVQPPSAPEHPRQP